MVQSNEEQAALHSSSDMLAFMENALREARFEYWTLSFTQRLCVKQASFSSVLQLEAAQGHEDPEARAQLDKLKLQTASLAQAEGQARSQQSPPTQAVDEIALARQLDQ